MSIRILRDFLRHATFVESPALQSSKPATNLVLTARDKTARTTSNATQTIKFHWNGDAYKCNGLRIFRHNGQGTSVRIKLYPNVDYTGTAYDSTALAMSTAITSDSYDWGIPRTSPDSANDLLLADAPYFLDFTEFTAKSGELIFTGIARSYLDIGRAMVGKYLELPYGPGDGMTVTPTVAPGGGRYRELTFDMVSRTDATRALMLDLIEQISYDPEQRRTRGGSLRAYGSEDVAITLFPAYGGRMERDHVINAALKAPVGHTLMPGLIARRSFTFVEV